MGHGEVGGLYACECQLQAVYSGERASEEDEDEEGLMAAVTWAGLPALTSFSQTLAPWWLPRTLTLTPPTITPQQHMKQPYATLMS